METTKVIATPLYYIDYFYPKSGKLADISEEGYKTLELCQAQIAAENKEDEEIKHELLKQYEENLRNFVLDLDTSDGEPVNPLLACWRMNKTPHLYIFDGYSHREVTEHLVPNLFTLDASAEQIETVNAILNRTLDPGSFQSVRKWVSQCHTIPAYNELQMCAINEVLEGYGIESVRTSKWKNGYWCNILCTYVKMGDSYITTVIYHRKHGFMISSIGDVIEKNKHVI
jgi:hypothetical protein